MATLLLVTRAVQPATVSLELPDCPDGEHWAVAGTARRDQGCGGGDTGPVVAVQLHCTGAKVIEVTPQ